jgi:hypothetical protein
MKTALGLLLAALPALALALPERREAAREAISLVDLETPVLAARPGEKFKLTFQNGSPQRHNFVLMSAGSEVLAQTELVEPGKSATLAFKAPEEPGEYPFLCTAPGHHHVWAVLRVRPDSIRSTRRGRAS